MGFLRESEIWKLMLSTLPLFLRFILLSLSLRGAFLPEDMGYTPESPYLRYGSLCARGGEPVSPLPCGQWMSVSSLKWIDCSSAHSFSAGPCLGLLGGIRRLPPSPAS